MLLVIDAGNTHIVLGLFAGSQLLDTWRVATDPLHTSDEYGQMAISLMQLKGYEYSEVQGVAISCVAPGILPTLIQMTDRYFRCEPIVITGETPTRLRVCYQPARSLGPDRLVNSVAAAHIYGMPVITVDLGTATTIDCVTPEARLIGGAIAPGIATSLEALLREAPGLPRVELQASKHCIGNSTVECMQLGLVNYAASAVDGLIRDMKAELHAEPVVVATGGLADMVMGISKEIQINNKDLTLHGLRLIYDENKPKQSKGSPSR